MNSYPTDAALLARSVAEPAVFGERYERHSLAVRRYVVRRIGVVSANHAVAVKNPRTRHTAPLINGRYFVMLSYPGPGPNHTSCVGCDNLRAINARGKVLEADYGPAQ